MNKFLLVSLSIVLYISSYSQAGLEGIIVEKYYITDEADSINAADNFAITPLRIGSTTYRVYADLLPGYEVIQIFGSEAHPLTISTTTDFYNDPNYGFSIYQGTSLNNTKKNTTLIDSYLTIGGVATGLMGVLKTTDTDGTIGNLQGILANNDPDAGIPIMGASGADGLMPGSPIVPNTLGLGSELDVFDQTAGNSFSTTGGTIAALGGMAGVTGENHVLLGQFTTNGILSFKLNVQIGTPVAGESQIFVAENPVGDEIQDSTLIFVSEIDNDTTSVFDRANFRGINEFEVYPVPTKDILYVHAIGNQFSPANVVITDLSGRVVIEERTTSRLKAVDVSGLAEGLYMVEIVKGNSIETLKFIKR